MKWQPHEEESTESQEDKTGQGENYPPVAPFEVHKTFSDPSKCGYKLISAEIIPQIVTMTHR